MKQDNFIEDIEALCRQYWGYDNRKYTIDYIIKKRRTMSGQKHKIIISFKPI